LKLTKELNEKHVDATLYKQLLGLLRYISNSRPDISYGVGLVSRFMTDPRTPHLLTSKHILRYLKGTTKLVLFYPRKIKQCDIMLEA